MSAEIDRAIITELELFEIQLKNILTRSREERSIDAAINRVSNLYAETSGRLVLMRRKQEPSP